MQDNCCRDIMQALTGALKEQSADPVHVYPASVAENDGAVLAAVRIGMVKFICVAAKDAAALPRDFNGGQQSLAGITFKLCPWNHDNAVALRKTQPWTAPVSLRMEKTTIGCGDRLGRATPGHLRAGKRFAVSPVLAQQSIRELNLTGRTYENVVDDVTFLVFQEGYRDGFGADGDHLKTLADINTAVDAGMAMITLDLSERMCAAAEKWSAVEVEKAFADLPAALQTRIMDDYADRSFTLGAESVVIEALEAKRCAVMYTAAMDFAAEVYVLLTKRRGESFDLEISIDETTAPTLPAHHLFVIRELLQRQVTISSMAPRFIGEFQKAIDYIGDLAEFEAQFAVHCAIAAAHGNYKISVHSGSDKFSVYPAIGRHTGHRVHVKTAGTSWLEAVRAVSVCDPALYRLIHHKAIGSFPEALKLYHVTPDLSRIPGLAQLPDAGLPPLLDEDNARQLLHVTYGSILQDPELGPAFLHCLDVHEDSYYQLLEKHFVKHLATLGVPERS